MNPGQLNKRLIFSDIGAIWGKKVIKTKRRDAEQNEEHYDFIVRKRSDLKEYSTFICEGVSYDVLTVDDYQKEKGFLFLKCEKSKIHSYYDSCTVNRLVEVEKENGATKHEYAIIYTSIPCELIRLISGSANQTEQQNNIIQRYEINTENQYEIKIGDLLEVLHKKDLYKAKVTNFFRTHTHQIVNIELESEA